MWDPWADAWRPTQMDDPPLARIPVADGSSDEESVPPPSAHTGLSRQLAFSMTIGQLGETLFGSSILQPGVVRILNGAGETLHHTTQMASLQIPRMLYYQTGDLETFNHISGVIDASVHDDVLTRDSEARLRLVSVRIFGTYVPPFRPLDLYSRMQYRISALETAVAQLQNQVAALSLARSPPDTTGNTTEISIPEEPVLEEY